MGLNLTLAIASIHIRKAIADKLEIVLPKKQKNRHT